jgi:hypothetical protein
MAEGEELCNHCGAPRMAGYAACKYCKTPFPHVGSMHGDPQTNAIPCPRCNTLNEAGVQKCVQCQTWLVVQCVFCHALSPHNAPACLRCGEAFAGAPQRFAERQQQQRLQQGLNIAGQVGNVAASFLGAAAAAGVFSGHHEHHYEHHHHHHGGGGEWGGTGAGIEQQSGGGGFLGSVFGGSSDAGGTGAGIEQSSGDSGGGGILDSLFGGDSSSNSSSDSGGSFWDSSGDSGSSDDSGGFWGGDD